MIRSWTTRAVFLAVALVPWPARARPGLPAVIDVGASGGDEADGMILKIEPADP